MYHYSIAPELGFAESIALCREIGVYNLEIDGTLDGVSLADLSPAAVQDYREALIDSGVRIVCAAIPAGLSDDALRRFFAAAYQLHVENVLAPKPESDDIDAYIALCTTPAKYAQSYGIGFLAVNEPDSILKTDDNVARVVRALAKYDCGSVFDTAAYQKTGAYPFFGALYSSHIKNRIRMIRLGDLDKSYAPVPFEHGICGLRECVSLLLARSFDGYFSLTALYGQKCAADWQKLLCDARHMLKNM